MLELADKDVEMAVVNIFKDVTDNMDIMNERTGTWSRDVEPRACSWRGQWPTESCRRKVQPA